MNQIGETPSRDDSPPDNLMFSLLEAARALETRLETALAGVGLSMAKHGVLTTLVDAGEALPLSELAARQKCVRSNITQLVDRLEAEGLVRRVDDPDDRRSIRAELTPLGRDRQAAGAAQLAAIQADFTASLSDAKRATIRGMLDRLK
jgi:DNA-binding MarR family transcriptional regulator